MIHLYSAFYGMNILQKIAANKKVEVKAMEKTFPKEVLREMADSIYRQPLSMSGAIMDKEIAIIAEHKRRSPSKGEISPMSNVYEIAGMYAENGAAAMSVLTDTPYFGGSLTDLSVARQAVPGLPLLRKEFVVDEYQILQARVYGADAVLLIASLLSAQELTLFNDYAHEHYLQTLVEVHSLEEVKKVPADADMVGVNNRDLTSFSTDIENSARMVEHLPHGIVKIAESGIKSPDDLLRLRSVGFDGFLIGEALMSTPNPGITLNRFLSCK